jgi:hypothetical protein
VPRHLEVAPDLDNRIDALLVGQSPSGGGRSRSREQRVERPQLSCIVDDGTADSPAAARMCNHRRQTQAELERPRQQAGRGRGHADDVDAETPQAGGDARRCSRPGLRVERILCRIRDRNPQPRAAGVRPR